ncbi:hypothetical protein DRQ50_00255 [bacterium]|nr:MAG: hypothetical protein DRQ50_00255 [bacterium]
MTNPIGWTYVSDRGYVVEKTESGRKFQHRLVMESHLGRELTDDEVAHHINEKRADNRLENLQLMTDKEHKSHHLQGRVFTQEAKDNMAAAQQRRRKRASKNESN